MKRTPLKRTNGRGDPSFLKPKACAICNLEFQPSNGINKYCGPLCQQAGEFKPRICQQCGEEYRKSYRNKTRYCSKACANRATGPARGQAQRRFNQWSIANKGEEACRNCGTPAQHLHHIVPRSKCRTLVTDYVSNGLPLCSACHRGWHHRSITLYHDLLTDLEFVAAVEFGGIVWVERNYPDREYIALQRLDEAVKARCLLPQRAESADERVTRLREEQAYAVELVGLYEAYRRTTNERLPDAA